MRIAYLDCFSGISGDMFLGALVDAGVPPQVFEQTVAALKISARLEVSRVTKSGISATKVDVFSLGEKDLPREEFQRLKTEGRNQGHSHENHDHDSFTGHSPFHRSSLHGRGLKEIRTIISAATISDAAKHTAIRMFESLGAAEARIHNTSIDQVHFHEVGAVDALVDITCAAVGAEHLKVEQWVCSPLNVGSGTVQCAHGMLPIPAPATLELLKDAPIYSSGPEVELVTPTGAAIVKTLVSRFEKLPTMKASHIGYGAGTRDFHGYPNVLRITLGEESKSDSIGETISVLETSLDDLSPQVFAYVLERALAEGALDAFGAPLQMKKSRPGMLLTVLSKPEHADRLAKLIFAETSTIGIRVREEKREVLERQWISVSTRYGDVRIKVASMNGATTNYAPEFEDCRQLALAQNVPLKSVMQEAMRCYLAETGSERKAPVEAVQFKANRQHG